MEIKELLKALGLEGDDAKDKAEILKKEFNEKTKELNALSKKNKELEENVNKLTEEATATKATADKLDIVVKAYGLDLAADDFDKMLDDAKDKIIKEAGGGTTPEEFKTLTRDLTKANRDLEKANTQIKELNVQLEAEKTMRIDALKRDNIQKALVANRVLKPEMMVDMFFNKVSVDKDGKTLTMKDAAGNEISLADGIADWASENKEFVQEDVRGGLGSAGGNGGSADNNAMSEFMKNIIADRGATPEAAKGKSLSELFG